MTILSPTMRYAMRKALAGQMNDPITYLAGGPPANAASPTNQQASAEVDYAVATRSIVFSFTDANTAATTIAETPIMSVDKLSAGGIQILGADICIQNALTASATVYATLVLARRSATKFTTAAYDTAYTFLAQSTKTNDNVFGAASSTQAFMNWTITPLTAQTASSGAALTTAQANAVCLPTDTLTFVLGKTSTGTALGACTITIHYLEL